MAAAHLLARPQKKTFNGEAWTPSLKSPAAGMDAADADEGEPGHGLGGGGGGPARLGQGLSGAEPGERPGMQVGLHCKG